jgi:molybdopterin-guanine dinucleotide biosynthesis protein A
MDISCVKTRIYGGILAGGSADRLGAKPNGLLDNRDGLSIIDGLIIARLLAQSSNL